MSNPALVSTPEKCGAKAMTGIGSVVLAGTGVLVSFLAAAFIIMYPSDRMVRGTVIIVSILTLLLGASAVYSTQCTSLPVCNNTWAYLFAALTVAVGVINAAFAHSSRSVASALTRGGGRRGARKQRR